MKAVIGKKKKEILAYLMPGIMIMGSYSFGVFFLDAIQSEGYSISIRLVVIPLFCFALLYDSAESIKKSNYSLHKYEIQLELFMLFWVLYGLTTLFVFPFSTLGAGMEEIMALLLGLMAVVIVNTLCRDGCWNQLLIGLKFAIWIVLIVCIFEIVTGKHAGFSRYSDDDYLMAVYYAKPAIHIPTSFYYNENNNAAMLALFSPFFISGVLNSKTVARCVNIAALCLIYMVILCDDAIICFLAYFLSLAVAFIMIPTAKRKWGPLVAGLLLTRLVIWLIRKSGFFENNMLMRNNKDCYIALVVCVLAGIALVVINMGIWKQMSICLLSTGVIFCLIRKIGILGSLISHNDNSFSTAKELSLFRVNTYRVSIRETLLKSKGLGFGAGSYTNYFSQFKETEQIEYNPHNFWLEILSEYGVVILLVFIIILCALMIVLIKKTKSSNEKTSQYIMIICSGLTLVFVSVAPSSFIREVYYWLPIAMASFLADEQEPDSVLLT